jgi:hypothetical protein
MRRASVPHFTACCAVVQAKEGRQHTGRVATGLQHSGCEANLLLQLKRLYRTRPEHPGCRNFPVKARVR